jgi:hypothetical protein
MLADVAVRASSPVLVGRSGQLAALDAALAAARDGSPSAVLVGGEAGVGKSRLVTEFAEQSRGTGAQVLTGGCLELGTDGLPFAPFTAVLRELVRERGADGIAGLLPGHATRELARLLPEFGEPAAAADAGEARARLFEQVLTLLEQLADEAPVVLVIEDAHWADRSTRDLLAFLIRNQGALDGLLIVVTYRSDELHRTHPLRPLLAELDRISWVTRIEPDGCPGPTPESWPPGCWAASRVPTGWRRCTAAPRATRCSWKPCWTVTGSAPGCRSPCATCWWPAYGGCRRRPRKWCGWPARAASGSAMRCWPRSPGWTAPGSPGRCGPRWRPMCC